MIVFTGNHYCKCDDLPKEVNLWGFKYQVEGSYWIKSRKSFGKTIKTCGFNNYVVLTDDEANQQGLIENHIFP